MQDDEAEPAKFKEVIKVVITAKLMTEVVTATATTITTAPSITRRRKGVVIRDPEETATQSVIVHFESKSKDKRKGILGRLEESQAQVYHLDLEHADKVLITVAATTAAPMPTANAPRRRKGVVIRDPEETATPSVIVHSEPK
nr:hypothetical protein [Tanacetum cinerariifolium]